MITARAVPLLFLSVAMAAAFALSGLARTSAAETGAISIKVTLEAGPEAAARTWRFEVLNSAGAVVETLIAATSGEALSSTVSTGAISHGVYTVRQVLTNDTKANCEGGAFYEVAAPAGGSANVELAGPSLNVAFTIRPCSALPRSLAVNIPVDTLTPTGGGVIGDADVLPETPIDVVRGTRSEGPGGPLPPATGNSPTAADTRDLVLTLALMLGLMLTLTSPAVTAAVVIRRGSKR